MVTLSKHLWPGIEVWLPMSIESVRRDATFHLWRFDTTGKHVLETTCAHLLSTDERARAARYAFARDRVRFVVSRGVLRMLIGHYLGLAPHEVVLLTTDHGKPYLPQAMGEGLSFNVSHAGDLGLIALGWNTTLGVDIEHIRALPDLMQLAHTVFSPPELDALTGLPDSLQTEAFFHTWTRKEAFVKALGSGLSHSLDGFAVSLDPEAPAAITWVRDALTLRDSCTLVCVRPGAGYAGALAYFGPAQPVHAFTLTSQKVQRWERGE